MNEVDPGSNAGLPNPTAWFIHIPPETHGPYGLEQLRALVRDGRVNSQTLTAAVGADSWGKAGDQPGLRTLFDAMSPPHPAPPAYAPAQQGEALAIPTDAPGRPMGFGEAVDICLKQKYATFQGRARRAEFWWFTLAFVLVMAVVSAVAGGVTAATQSGDGSVSVIAIIVGALGGVVLLGLIVPAISVTVRRLHDLGFSGWWYLGPIIPIVGGFIAIYLYIKYMMRGDIGPNAYGPDPLSEG